MSLTHKLRVVCAIFCVALCDQARGSDPSSGSGDSSLVIPRKSGRWRDRASEFVQRTPNFSVRDGDKTISPSRVGYVFTMEHSEGGKLLLVNKTQSLQGWALATEVIRLSEAEAFFSREIQANPQSSFAHLMRGIVRHDNDDQDHALADLDAALRLDSKSVAALTTRAYFWQCKDRIDRAMTDVNKAIELDPQCAYAFAERAFLHFTQKRFEESVHDFDRATGLGSRSLDIEVCRGMIDLETKELEKAEAKFDRVLKIDPTRQDACCLLARTQSMKLEPEKALSYFNRAIQIDPKFPYSYRQRAIFFLSRFEYEKAVDDMNEAIKLDPSCAEFYVTRLAVWLNRADFDRALEDVEAAIRLDRNDAETQGLRAWILAACPVARIRKGDQAVVSATRACELTKWKDAAFLGVLAAASSETGDFEAAARWQMKAIEYLDLNDPEETGYREILECYNAKKTYHSVGMFMAIVRPDANKP